MNKDIDEILDQESTTSDSSSSNTQPFINNEPLILELHELKKDDPASGIPVPETPPAAVEEAKTKKLKKKKRTRDTSKVQARTSSSTPSEASLHPLALETAKEEFYDAHESYYAMPPEQTASMANPLAGARLVQVQQGQDPKLTIQHGYSAAALSVAKEPTTMSTPVLPPK